MPKFSVLIPTHDHAETLFYSVPTALAQTEQDFEILIVGDGPPPRTREVAAELQRRDPRIQYFEFPKGERHGERHRHTVLERVSSPYVAYLTDDDLWFPEHLETLGRLLEQHDIAATLELDIPAEGGIPNCPGFHPECFGLREALARNLLTFGLPSAGHTLAAYRRLPEGWRPAPPDTHSDQHMWRQFADQPWCRFGEYFFPTVAHFGSPPRKERTLAERCAELADWTERIATPAGRLRISAEFMAEHCGRLWSRAQRLPLLAAAIEGFALHHDQPGGKAAPSRGAGPKRAGQATRTKPVPSNPTATPPPAPTGPAPTSPAPTGPMPTGLAPENRPPAWTAGFAPDGVLAAAARFIAPPCRPGEPVSFAAGAAGERFLAHGFWAAERWGAWMCGTTATLVLPLAEPLSEPHLVRFRLRALRHETKLPCQEVRVVVNGEAATVWQVAASKLHGQRSAVVPRRALVGRKELVVQFHAPQATSLKDLGLGLDDRVLGVGLAELEILPAPRQSPPPPFYTRLFQRLARSIGG